jgi:hypothetical protein
MGSAEHSKLSEMIELTLYDSARNDVSTAQLAQLKKMFSSARSANKNVQLSSE